MKKAFLILINFYFLFSSTGYAKYIDLETNKEFIWNLLPGDDRGIPYLVGKTLDLAGSETNFCALEENFDVKCWNRNSEHRRKDMELRGLKDPKMIAVGKNHVCAIDENQVKCMEGMNSSPSDVYKNANVMKIPSGIKNPRMIAAGEFHTCVLDDEGIKCWGNVDGYGMTAMPKFSNPIKLIAQKAYTCARDDNGIQCWGGKIWGHDFLCITNGACSNSFYTLDPITLDRTYIKDICKSSSLHLQCHPFSTLARFAQRPTYYAGSLFSDSSCALTNGKLTCWGVFGHQSPYPNYMDNPLVLAGSDTKCMMNNQGIKCFKMEKNKFERLGEMSFDQSKYFYTEKSLPLTKMQEIVTDESLSVKEFISLAYFREVAVEKFLTGVNTENSEVMRNNSRHIRTSFKYGFITAQDLANRDVVQLKFILNSVVSSLSSSKLLLSSSAKQVVDAHILELANLLSSDVITIDAATEVLNGVVTNESLMSEMNGSYRLVGIASFWTWAQHYFATGIVD